MQVLLLEKGDIDKIMEEYSLLQGHQGIYFTYKAWVSAPAAILAYERGLSPSELKRDPIDFTRLEGAPVVDYFNEVHEGINGKQLKPFFLKTRIPLLGDRRDFGAYTGKIEHFWDECRWAE